MIAKEMLKSIEIIQKLKLTMKRVQIAKERQKVMIFL